MKHLICPTCGREVGYYYGDVLSMKEDGECFECSFWRKELAFIGNPNVAIIDGVHYTIDDENSKDLFRGFNGRKFVINFKDGRQVTTTNLKCLGDIPDAWKSKFPDNADFDWKWKRIGNSNYLVKK